MISHLRTKIEIDGMLNVETQAQYCTRAGIEVKRFSVIMHSYSLRPPEKNLKVHEVDECNSLTF